MHWIIRRSWVFVVAIMGLGKTSIKLRGAEVGIEAVMLGVVTSIGGM